MNMKIFLFLIVTVVTANGQNIENGRIKLKKSLQLVSPKDTACFAFNQTLRQFGHYSKPWETVKYELKGNCIFNSGKDYFRHDSLIYNGQIAHGFTQFN